MIQPYALPRAFETEALTAQLMRLSAKQRRVVREYVDVVEIGGTLVTEWLRLPGCPVSENEWYKREAKGGHYKNNALFADVLAEYTRAALKADVDERLRSIGASKRTLQLGSIAAARRLVHEVDHGERSADRIKASEAVLDRADKDLAAKGEIGVEVSDARERLARLLGADAADGAEAGGAGEAE